MQIIVLSRYIFTVQSHVYDAGYCFFVSPDWTTFLLQQQQQKISTFNKRAKVIQFFHNMEPMQPIHSFIDEKTSNHYTPKKSRLAKGT